jgi:hypothetical protein
MARADQIEVRARIVIEQPVAGVLHSLQEDDAPLDPKASQAGEPLAFEFPLRIERTADGAKFFGRQVRREGPVRRFVYIRVGTAAGQRMSQWTRRMKIDIRCGDRGQGARGNDRRDCPRWKSGLRDDPAGKVANCVNARILQSRGAHLTVRQGGNRRPVR